MIREDVEIHFAPRHFDHLATIVGPVLVSDLPDGALCPHGLTQTSFALHELIDVVLLDSHANRPAAVALASAAEVARSLCVVEPAWLRIALWRERLAAERRPAGAPHRG